MSGKQFTNRAADQIIAYAAAPQTKDDFARQLGFVSYLDMFEASNARCFDRRQIMGHHADKTRQVVGLERANPAVVP
jgi:hypothetical protein